MTCESARADHRIIAGIIAPGSAVLDLGCGDGSLLALLAEAGNVRGQGLEIDEQAVYACVARGVSVLHGDVDTGLSEYGDSSFDYVILNQSLQQVRHLDGVLSDALRVGRRVIVGLPNFAHIRSRCQLFFLGRAPVTAALPYTWHESPNLHFVSIADFLAYCVQQGIRIERREFLSGNRRVVFWPNLLAESAVFVISRASLTSRGGGSSYKTRADAPR